MSDQTKRSGNCPHTLPYEECDECRTPSSLAAPAGSTSPDQERLDFLATIVRLELTADEKAYTMPAHVKGVLKVLIKMGLIR